MMYKVEKCDTKSDTWFDYGIYSEADVKLIVRGYHFNGLFYEKKNSHTIYTITEVEEA